MASLALGFETNIRQTVGALLRRFMGGLVFDSDVSVDLVLMNGVSQGALWSCGKDYEFVPTEPVSDQVAELARQIYKSRADFLAAAAEAGAAMKLTPLRF